MSPEINISGTSLCYCRDALGLYKVYLSERNRKGNTTIEKELYTVSGAHRSIMNEFHRRHGRENLQDWMTMEFDISDASCRLLKALLPIYKRKYELEKQAALNAGESPASLEHIDVHIAKVEEIMGWNFLHQVDPHPLLVGQGQLLVNEERAAQPTETEARTIINIQHLEGRNVVVGSHNIVVQEAYVEASAALESLLKTVNVSDLSAEKKKDIEADVTTIQTQLSKSSPSAKIISTAYSAIEKVVTTGGAVELVHQVGQLLAKFLG